MPYGKGTYGKQVGRPKKPQQEKKYTDKELNDWLKNESGISVQGPGTGNLRREDVIRMYEKAQQPKQVGVNRLGSKSAPPVGLDKTQIANYQKFLQHYGYYGGKIDSIWGPKTQAAHIKYKDQPRIPPQSEGMRDSGMGGKLGDRIMDYLRKLRN